MAVSRIRVTTDEFERLLALPENAERRLELIDGEMVEKMPTQLHAYIIALLTTALINFLKQNPLGRALVEARYRLPGDKENDRIPDLSFVSNQKGELVKRGPAPYMPDLAVEVQSPNQSDKLMADKAAYYLANGSRMVWLIYPDRRLIEVLTPNDRKLLTSKDILSGGDVLPNFEVQVLDIIPED
jgi:Uma2 family endonuclease